MTTISPAKRHTAPKHPAKPTDPPKPPKDDPADEPTAAAPEAPKVHGSIFLQLGRQADLRDLADRPAGPDRRAEAVARMHALADSEQEQVAPEISKLLKKVLKAQGFQHPEVEVGDRLWLTNGLTFDITAEMPSLFSLFGDAKKTAAITGAVQGAKGVTFAAPVDQLKIDAPEAVDFRDDAGTAAAAEAAKGGRRTTPWNLSLIGAPTAWRQGARGKGVTVANVDTGVDVANPNLASKFRGYDPDNGFTQETNYYDAYAANRKVGSRDRQPVDDVGHGTHTMGTMVGDDGVGSPIGIAPDAKFIAARGLTKKGGDVVSLLKSMQWVVAPKDHWGQEHPEKGADIVNNSWGGMTADFDFTAALRNMADAGVVNVFAAGNAGRFAPDQTLGDPGMWEDVVTVGAVDRHGDVTDFSSKGPSPVTRDYKPDVVAPGHQVVSALPGGTREAWSGTSMATPHVAGALAVVDSLLEKKGQAPLDLDDAKFVLKRMTKDVGPKGPDNASGYGLVDLRRMSTAVNALIRERKASA